jgi:hypothetical protein
MLLFTLDCYGIAGHEYCSEVGMRCTIFESGSLVDHERDVSSTWSMWEVSERKSGTYTVFVLRDMVGDGSDNAGIFDSDFELISQGAIQTHAKLLSLQMLFQTP